MAAADAHAGGSGTATAGSGSSTGAAATSASSGATAVAGFEDVDISEVEIGKKLGGGGFAVVFHARWRGKRVAAKVLVDPKISDALRKEFMDELHVMRSVRHPNIVKCLAACTTPPRMAFVMEMCGDSMFMVLHTPKACHWAGALKPIGLARLVGWARGIADALAYLHACSPKIVHRDVKTHNLLLAGDGSLKLCDFGLVHHPDVGAGTPQYMAPELLAGGKRGYTDKVDVYAFGIMLWEMLARRIPFAGWRLEDIVEQVQKDTRPKITDIPATHITPDLRAIIEECWAQEPSKRPSMAQVAARLKAWTAPSSAVASTTRRVGGDALDALMR